MKKETTFTAKQVGGRIKERRTELNITMPELGRRVGVNKSTIQRYEADGVNPKRTMVINGLAEALLTTPEWLTGLSLGFYTDNILDFVDSHRNVLQE